VLIDTTAGSNLGSTALTSMLPVAVVMAGWRDAGGRAVTAVVAVSDGREAGLLWWKATAPTRPTRPAAAATAPMRSHPAVPLRMEGPRRRRPSAGWPAVARRSGRPSPEGRAATRRTWSCPPHCPSFLTPAVDPCAARRITSTHRTSRLSGSPQARCDRHVVTRPIGEAKTVKPKIVAGIVAGSLLAGGAIGAPCSAPSGPPPRRRPRIPRAGAAGGAVHRQRPDFKGNRTPPTRVARDAARGRPRLGPGLRSRRPGRSRPERGLGPRGQREPRAGGGRGRGQSRRSVHRSGTGASHRQHLDPTRPRAPRSHPQRGARGPSHRRKRNADAPPRHRHGRGAVRRPRAGSVRGQEGHRRPRHVIERLMVCLLPGATVSSRARPDWPRHWRCPLWPT